MLVKSDVIESLETLEEEFSIDELFERILFIEKVNEGRKDSQEGRTTPHDEFKKEILEWSK